MNTMMAWAQAARFPSQIYLLLPICLGQLWARHAGYPWHEDIFYLAIAFALFDQLYIVFANDYADREADALNEHPTPFSGGSRVLVDNKLTPGALLRGAQVAALGCLGVGTVLSVAYDRAWAIALVLAALGLLWAYSFRPIHASYRGFGVLLQTLGIGVVLPIAGFYVQAGTFHGFPLSPMGIVALAQISCAMATALPDLEADQRAGKNTLVVQLGTRASQLSMAFVLGVAACLQGILAQDAPGNPAAYWVCIPLGLAILAGAIPRAVHGTHRLLAVAICTISGALGIELIYILAII